MRLSLHIENLRLEGLEGASALDRRELALQIQGELQRLVAIWGPPPGLAGEDGAVRLSGQTVRLAPGTAREKIGAEVARQLAGGWFGSSR